NGSTILLMDQWNAVKHTLPLHDALPICRNAFGRQVDSFEEDVPFAGFAEPLHAVFIRAPWVESVGAKVDVLATVPDTPAAGAAAGKIVAVRQQAVLATAFHPEITGDLRVHELFVGMVSAARA